MIIFEFSVVGVATTKAGRNESRILVIAFNLYWIARFVKAGCYCFSFPSFVASKFAFGENLGNRGDSKIYIPYASHLPKSNDDLPCQLSNNSRNDNCAQPLASSGNVMRME